MFHADFEFVSFALPSLSRCQTTHVNKNTANSHKGLYKHQQKVTYYLMKIPINFITNNPDRICHPK